MPDELINKTREQAEAQDELVMGLVGLALAQPTQNRESYLRSACGADSGLFNQVWDYVQAEERMKGFLLDPLFPPPAFEHPFEPGELLDGRFRITREVSQGGMGVVYEAHDERLERRIALKCAKAGFRKRLPPEVRNASAISHPNVCKIFEIHTATSLQGDIDFITMEFLDGETLAERLHQGPLSPQEATTVARQLCDGLAEAHRNQVVHGDLKSSNIILTKDADGAIRAVITDFGLARSVKSAQRTAQSGALGGTPDYMAPELWKGEKASVASDIYALGVILYELVSARRPFTGAPWEEQVNRKPPAVHPAWDRILARCLDSDAARRFRDAGEIAAALAPRSRTWLLAAAAALALAIASGVATYQSVTAPAESVRLALLPFADPPLMREISEQLGRLKSSSRTRLSFVAPRDRVDTVEKARAELGATHVLHGTLTQENKNVILHAYLTDTRSGINTRDWTAKYAPGELRYVPVALAGMVTGTLRLPPLAVANVNAAAKQDFRDGLYFIRRNSGVDNAVTLLERAVAADPDSALAYAGLAEAQWLKFALTREQPWLDRTEESVRKAEDRNPDLSLLRSVAGQLKANVGLYEQAAADYRRAIELDPHNADAFIRLGAVFQSNNQPDEALTAYRKAVEAQPDYARAYQGLGAFYTSRANYEQATETFQRMVAVAPDLPVSHFVLASSYEHLGRLADAEKELRISISLQDNSNAQHELGYTLMLDGRDQQAIACFLRAIALGPETELVWLNLGVSYSRTGQKRESQAAFRRGLALAEKEMMKDPRKGRTRSRLGYLSARLGDSRRAQSETVQAIQLSPNDEDTRWRAAATYETIGKRDWTLAILGSSPAAMLPSLLTRVNGDPDLAGLQKDPRFIELLASYNVK